MTPLRIVIADDEPLAVKLLETYCRRLPDIASIDAYTDPAQALERIARGDVHLAVLDIQMPGLSGMELARRVADSGVKVIFVTAFADYALDGFRVHAADYLLKPVSYADFSGAVERIRATLPADDCLTVTADYRRHRIDCRDIVLISGCGDYARITVAGRPRPILTQMSLKELSARLPADAFVRVHRSHIVGRRWIQSYDRATLSLGDYGTIPIGKNYRVDI